MNTRSTPETEIAAGAGAKANSARGVKVELRVTAGERRLLNRAADLNALPTSTWARWVLLREAKDVVGGRQAELGGLWPAAVDTSTPVEIEQGHG
jgi:hypothetical protein